MKGKGFGDLNEMGLLLSHFPGLACESFATTNRVLFSSQFTSCQEKKKTSLADSCELYN